MRGILIDSWGLLQPTSQKGPLGREGTGLRTARNALEEKIATWQAGSTGVPYFRLLFLQYIFPLEKNLNICSFFYDFVTRRDFGKRLETFQYNHITNYSIRGGRIRGKGPMGRGPRPCLDDPSSPKENPESVHHRGSERQPLPMRSRG